MKALTSVTITEEAATTPVNQPLIVTLTPNPVAGIPLPTGTVTLIVNSTPYPAANLVNGTATVTVPANSLQVGYVGLTGAYSGDAYYTAASSVGSATITGSGTLLPTVTISAPTTAVNPPVSVTVTVSGPNGDPIPTGSVMLSTTYSGNPLTLTNGSATFTYQSGGSLVSGPNTLTATYLGDSNYTSGVGTATVTLATLVQKAPTFIAIGPSAGAIVVNQSLNVQVSVTGTFNGPIPTGTITLSRGNYTSPAGTLNAETYDGVATFVIPPNSLSIGTDYLVASYSGDSVYAANSYSIAIIVDPIGPSFSLSPQPT